MHPEGFLTFFTDVDFVMQVTQMCRKKYPTFLGKPQQEKTKPCILFAFCSFVEVSVCGRCGCCPSASLTNNLAVFLGHFL